jgi:MFS transporter, FHS family, glucose/mannose:H+ symporter
LPTEKNYHFSQVFAAACLGMLLFGIVMLTLGSTLPEIMSKYQLDDLNAGSLASLLPSGILLGSLIFGPIVDRFSYKYLLVLCSLAVSLGMFGIAVAPGLLLLQVSFFLIGFGGGAINGGTNALVADISRDRAQAGSANLSLLGVFFGIGALTVPSVMALLSQSLTYSEILTWIGILVAGPVVYFLWIRYPLPKQSRSISLKESATLFRSRSLLILAFVLFFQSAFEGIFNNWTTTFLQRVRLFSEADALTCLSIYVIGLTVTRLLLAALLRVVKEKPVLYLSIAFLLSGVLILMSLEDLYWVYLGSALLGIGTAAVFPVILGFVSEMYQEMRGTAFSVVIFIAVFGNILINFMMGMLAGKYGIDLYPWVLIFCVLMIFIIFSIWDRKGTDRINS